LPELFLDDLAGPLELGLERGVDLGLAGADHRAAASDAAVGLDLEVLDAAQLVDQRRCVLAGDVQVLGRDEHDHALALEQAAQPAAHRVGDALGLDGDRALHRLLGDAQRELDGGGLGLVGQARAQRGEVGGRALQSAAAGSMTERASAAPWA
jgi:hypothetical protein